MRPRSLYPLADVIDIGAERERLDREIAKVDGDINRLDAKLNNEKFTANAPEDVVNASRERRSEGDQYEG